MQHCQLVSHTMSTTIGKRSKIRYNSTTTTTTEYRPASLLLLHSIQRANKSIRVQSSEPRAATTKNLSRSDIRRRTDIQRQSTDHSHTGNKNAYLFQYIASYLYNI